MGGGDRSRSTEISFDWSEIRQKVSLKIKDYGHVGLEMLKSLYGKNDMNSIVALVHPEICRRHILWSQPTTFLWKVNDCSMLLEELIKEERV